MGKLTAIKTYARFQSLREANEISETSLNFILDTGQLYTHGIFLNSVLFGTVTSDSVVLNVAGVSKTVSLSGHSHSNYYNNTSDIDIGSNKIVSSLSELLKTDANGNLILGNSDITTKIYGTIKAIRSSNEYTILDTGNFSIANKTISGNDSSNAVTVSYGGNNFQIDYVKRLNTISALNSLATYTNMGTTNENSKAYGFITMYTDGTIINPLYAQIRVNIPDALLEFRTSSNVSWKTVLTGGAYQNLTVNGSTYAIATTSVSLPTMWVPSSLGIGGQYLTTADDGLSLTWRTLTYPANGLNTAGIVAGTTSSDTYKVWKTNDQGVPAWRDEVSYSADNNGITVSNNQFKLSLLSTTNNVNEIGNKLYAVELDKNGKLAVTVPWTEYSVVTTSSTGLAPAFSVANQANSSSDNNYYFLGWTNSTIKWYSLPANTFVNTWIAFVGATSESNGTAGYVPAPGQGNQDLFFKGDGTWAAPTNTWIAWQGATAQDAGTAGYMPAPTSAQKDQFLRGDGQWVNLNNYTLPTATTIALGGILISNILDSAVTLTSSSTADRYYGVQIDSNGLAFVNIPWTNTWTAWVGATSESDGTAGYMPACTSNDRTKFLRGDGQWIALNDYTLTAATTSDLGGIIIADIIDDTITPTISTTSGRYYGIQLDENDLAVVNVPWSDTWVQYVGATSESDATAGYIPAAQSSERNYFFRGDGTWQDLSVSYYNLIFGDGTDTIMTYQPTTSPSKTIVSGSNIIFSENNNVLTISSTNTWTAFVGATSEAAGTSGYIPAPSSGQTNLYFRSNGTWDTPENTWRGIYVEGVSQLGTGTNTKPINFKAGDNVTLTFETAGTGSGESGSANYANIKINASNTTYAFSLNGTAVCAGTVDLGSIYAPTSAGTGLLRGTISGNAFSWSWDNNTYVLSSDYTLATLTTNSIALSSTDWTATGLTSSTSGLTTSGTYVVQLLQGSGYYSGVMSWYANTGGADEEIALHYAGPTAANSLTRLYMKTGDGKIYMAADAAVTATQYTIKIRKII